jgi:membrane protein YqaA with SNARE-associated domain
MEWLRLTTEHGPYVALAVVSFVSAVFPIVSAELAMAGLVASLPNTDLLVLILVATGAQMAGKSAMYWVGRRASVLTSKHGRAIERWGSRLRGSRRSVGGLVFLSSASGLPPFYVISTLAGTFRVSFAAFILVGTAGRFLRFAAVGLFPLAIRSIAA